MSAAPTGFWKAEPRSLRSSPSCYRSTRSFPLTSASRLRSSLQRASNSGTAEGAAGLQALSRKDKIYFEALQPRFFAYSLICSLTFTDGRKIYRIFPILPFGGMRMAMRAFYLNLSVRFMCFSVHMQMLMHQLAVQMGMLVHQIGR
jgi:hypothetical protein